jgi:hypothetical protein
VYAHKLPSPFTKSKSLIKIPSNVESNSHTYLKCLITSIRSGRENLLFNYINLKSKLYRPDRVKYYQKAQMFKKIHYPKIKINLTVKLNAKNLYTQ